MTRVLLTVALSAGVILSSGCHSMRFNIADGSTASSVTERRHFFLWGLVPERKIDVSRHCARGAGSIKDEQTVVDGFLGLITLGIYAPRTSEYHCL